MKNVRKQTIGENLLYVMVWLAIILVPVLNSQMMSEMHVSLQNVLIAWRQISPYLIIFLVHNIVLAPRFALKRRYVAYVLSDLAFIVLIFWGVKLYESHLAEQLPAIDPEAFDEYRRATFSNLEIYWNVVLAIFMTGANLGIKLIYQSMRDEQQMEELKRRNLQSEMDYLKYQINPHFFMNTLNNIHALIDIDAESAKRAVIELSKMMRYVLYDSGIEQVSLERDIQFIENYIELMRIRYTDAVDIRVEYPETLSRGVSIPPLLLIVFVENAFKHGVSSHRPSFIHMRLESLGGRLCATIENSVHAHAAPRRDSGIGLENVRKRLELIYGEEGYSLDIREEPDRYTVQLVIPATHA